MTFFPTNQIARIKQKSFILNYKASIVSQAPFPLDVKGLDIGLQMCLLMMFLQILHAATYQEGE